MNNVAESGDFNPNNMPEIKTSITRELDHIGIDVDVEVFKWQFWVKPTLILLLIVFLVLESIHIYCLSEKVIDPCFKISAQNAGLLKIFIYGYFASIVGVVVVISTMVGIWPTKKKKQLDSD